MCAEDLIGPASGLGHFIYHVCPAALGCCTPAGTIQAWLSYADVLQVGNLTTRLPVLGARLRP